MDIIPSSWAQTIVFVRLFLNNVELQSLLNVSNVFNGFEWFYIDFMTIVFGRTFSTNATKIIVIYVCMGESFACTHSQILVHTLNLNNANFSATEKVINMGFVFDWHLHERSNNKNNKNIAKFIYRYTAQEKINSNDFDMSVWLPWNESTFRDKWCCLGFSFYFSFSLFHRRHRIQKPFIFGIFSCSRRTSN